MMSDAEHLFVTFFADSQYHICRLFADHPFASHVEHDGVDIYNGIHGTQRAFLPFFYLRQILFVTEVTIASLTSKP